jgi:hypothetical protein
MSFKQYLGAFLLGAAAFLYSPIAPAEDKEARIEFQDKGTRGIPGIGKPDLEAIIKTSAWTENNKVLFSVKTEDCSIEEHSRIFIGLQIDADPINMIQRAYVKTTEGEKEVDLSSSSILKEVDKLIGKGIVKLADNIPFFSDGIDLVQWLSGSEDKKIEEKMRKENRLLLRELPLHTKFILNPIIGLSYEIPIDRTLTEIPQIIFKISLKDNYGRIQTMPDVYLKCDKKSQKPQQTRVPKSDLEKFLLEDILNSGARLHTFENKNCKFTLKEFYDPGELSKALGITVKNSYLVKYHFELPRPDGTYETDFYLALIDSNADKHLVSNKHTNTLEDIDSKHSVMHINLEWPGKDFLPKNIDTEDSNFGVIDFKNITDLHTLYGSIARSLQIRSRNNPLFMYIEY